MTSLDIDTLPLAERQRIQRRKAVRTALALAVVAVMVFTLYVWQVARMAG